MLIGPLRQGSIGGWRDYMKKFRAGHARSRRTIQDEPMGRLELRFGFKNESEMKALDRGDAANAGVGIITAGPLQAKSYDFWLQAAAPTPRSIGTRFR